MSCYTQNNNCASGNSNRYWRMGPCGCPCVMPGPAGPQGPQGPEGPTGPAGGSGFENTEPITARAYTVNQCASRIDIWSSASGESLGSILLSDQPVAITINQATKIAYVTTSGGIEVVDLTSNLLIGAIPGGYYSKPAVNPATNRIYALNQSTQSIDVIDGASNAVTATIQMQERPYSIAVDSAANKIYAALPGSNAVEVIDGVTDQIADTIFVTSPYQVAANPNIHSIYVAGQNPVSTSPSAGAMLTTIDSNTDTVTNRQAFPSTSWASQTAIAVNTATNQLTISSNATSGSTYLFDSRGNLIRTFGVPYFNGIVSSATNPESGSTYETSTSQGLMIHNTAGNEMQVIPAACAVGVDVTNL